MASQQTVHSMPATMPPASLHGLHRQPAAPAGGGQACQKLVPRAAQHTQAAACRGLSGGFTAAFCNQCTPNLPHAHNNGAGSACSTPAWPTQAAR
jgi:hypothetical protein